MKRKYDAKYFLEFFQKIPSKEMGSGSIAEHCALYHLNGGETYTDTPRVDALARIIRQTVPKLISSSCTTPHETVYTVNDAAGQESKLLKRLGRTPKARFLKVLRLALKEQSKRKTRKEKAK